ncbi:OX-2 membrane glycoprotein-like [Hemicordylus capensis]|uniref:OX-2 membrane glycoprotein-like n=1 Tax=Hemicordylus capensis TaxID=884348 RepID=UPI0023044190|nr:OX-2 membrane glycoprotein-like [Hemicordylus capensis]
MISASLYIWVLWTIVTGATQVVHNSIQTSTVGENVTLHCQLAEHYDVVQVTWQKEHGKDKTNIATYSKTRGSKVLGHYKNHVQISQSGLSASAITFYAVTLKDEGCYNCIFNTFPLGSIPGRTCLKVYTLSEPKVDVKRVTSPDNAEGEALEISCSVTGRPAPVITWKISKHLQIEPSQYVIKYPNHTVTVVSNFTHLSPKNIWKNSIICVVQHPSLNTTQELTLPEIVTEQEQNEDPGIAVVITSCISVVILVLGLVIVTIFCWRRSLPVDKKHVLPRWVLPSCPGIETCRKYSYTGNQVAVQPLHEGNLLNR